MSQIKQINIFTLVHNAFEGINGIEITEDEPITVEALYLLKLGALLNETSFRTIGNDVVIFTIFYR